MKLITPSSSQNSTHQICLDLKNLGYDELKITRILPLFLKSIFKALIHKSSPSS